MTAAGQWGVKMIPVRDNVDNGGRAWATYLLIFINVAVFFYFGRRPYFLMNRTHRLYGFTPGLFFGYYRSSGGLSPWLTLLTSQFFHSSIGHIVSNMLYLWVFGDNVEHEMGHIPFLIFYLLSGAGGTLFYAIFNMNSATPLIGASGAIAGVLGAYFILFPKAHIRGFVPLLFIIMPISVPAIWFLGGWFAMNLYNNSFSGNSSSVAYAAHIDGFILGCLVGYWLKRQRRNRWELLPPEPE